MYRAALVGLAVLVGCSGSHGQGAAVPREVAAELTPALAPLAWWLGDWDDGASSEHWIAAGGAIYGVALHGDTFEVMVIDDGDGPGAPDGVLRFYAMPGGARAVEFRQRGLEDGAAAFANEAHDFPKTIAYQRAPDRDGLTAVIGGGGRSISFAWKRVAARPAPELEDADRAFAADTAQRGVDGWVAAFDPDGGMMSKAGRVDHAGIGEAMGATLAAGRLSWEPLASGRAGALGFTVGKATYTGATPADGWRSTYVTVWRRQADGAWKVLFDTGRPVQDG